MRGWLGKQDSSGLRLWKRRWFVLVDLCLFYYRAASSKCGAASPCPATRSASCPRPPRAPRAPRFLFTAEHPGMRTYCLGAETPEELNAWVCALRQGAAPLPGSPCSLSLQAPQEPPGVGPPSPARPPGWGSLCPPGEGLGTPPTPLPHRPPAPPLLPGKEEAPAREGPGGTEDTRGEPRGPPVGAAAAGGCRPRPRPRLHRGAAPAPPHPDPASPREEPEEAPPPRSSDQPAAAPWGRQGAGRSGARPRGQSDTDLSK
ncbi:uncharacterized protein LJ206_016583 [Theristicus caerulescens]